MLFSLPPLPTWDGLHPLVTHFPIALLLVAPLFVVLGLVRRPSGRAFLLAALLLMVLGTTAIFVAVPTGEAAGRLAERTPLVNQVLERHEELAEATRVLFTALTAIFAVIVFGPVVLKKELERRSTLALHVAFLILYGAGAAVL
ncbi:MAG TPA: DUF2231 domain-containing protein, partial [Thermoanaerobaculia bacterium]